MSKISRNRPGASASVGTESTTKKASKPEATEPTHPLVGLSQAAQEELLGLCEQFIFANYQSPDNTPPDSYEILKALLQRQTQQ